MPGILKSFEQFKAASEGARQFVIQRGDDSIRIETSQYGYKGKSTKEITDFLASVPDSSKIEIDHWEDDAQFFS